MPALNNQTIGFIGLGLMGRPMAKNLRAAGANLHLFTRSQDAIHDLINDGAANHLTARELALKVGANPIIIMVTDTPSIKAVLTGPDGLLAGLSKGAIVIDMGTTQVMDTKDFAALVGEKGAHYIDAPVSGGEVGAKETSLSIMMGGAEEDIARALPLMQVMGKNITHIGPVGCGQITKTANQMIVALTIGAVAEALVLAQSAGADPAKVREALIGGFASSRILELHGKRMVDESFTPGARSTVQLKDVNQALALADDLNIKLPGLEANKALWVKMIEFGWGDLDHSALIKIIK